MTVELLQDVIDRVGPFMALVYSVKRITGGLHRQCWDVESFAIRRDGGEAGRDAETHSLQSAELLHCVIYLLRVRSLRVENGFCIVQDYQHLL
jgi:hypothetical protein